MRVAAKLSVPDDVSMTLTVSMSIKHWREFRKGLRTQWPDWEIAGAIDSAISQAEKTSWDIVEDTPQ